MHLIHLSLFVILSIILCSCSTTSTTSSSQQNVREAVATVSADPRDEVIPEENVIRNVRTTAYTHGEADHIKYKKSTASGGTLRYGYLRSAAADWSRFPLGTRFKILGDPHIYEVDDYGGALVGTGTIDLYKPNFGSMNDWGVRRVDIDILEWGCYERSLHILSPRQRFAHVRKMVNSIQNSNRPVIR